MYISSFQDLSQYDRTTVGGKALNLRELVSAGLPVPPGFLVLTTAYERFVTANDLQAAIERLVQTVSPDQPATAETVAQEISGLFEQGTLPAEIERAVLDAYRQLAVPIVAVRSSATTEDLPGTSFAGLHETFLGPGSAAEVFSALKRCWASLWSARALIYRLRHHIPHHAARMAVIVQQMVEASASGILFTCNPVTGARDEMVLNATFGLGEAVVNGQVSPDTITLNRQNGQVRHLAVAKKMLMTVPTSNGVATQAIPTQEQTLPVLSASQITRLFELGTAVEEHFGVPQDIEWAVADDQVFLLQARPVTTQGEKQTVTVRQEELPVPGDDTIHAWRLLRRIPSMISEARKAAKEQPAVPKQPRQKRPRRSPEQLLAQIDTWVDAFQCTDLSQLDDRALWDFVPLWIERGKELRPILLAAGLAGIAFYFLERKVSKWTGKPGQATVLVQALSGVYTAEVGSLLWQMAHMLNEAELAEVVQEYPADKALELLRERAEAQPFLARYEAFLQRHGYRCPNDAELHNPRWAEQPAQVIEMVKNYLRMDESANPQVVEQRRKHEREEAIRRINAQINPLRRLLFHWLLKQAQDKARRRDNNRSYIAKFLFPMRLLLAEFGRRWAARGWLADPDDIFFLTLYEIGDIISTEHPLVQESDLIATTTARRTAFDYWHTINAPAALGPGGVPLPDPQPTGPYLQGLPASAGRIRGTARLVESVSEATQLVSGEILVTRSTDPGWTPVFPLVSGLVLETGGLLSHGAIVAREYGAIDSVQKCIQTYSKGKI
jgi:pyruvate,water dikinase